MLRSLLACILQKFTHLIIKSLGMIGPIIPRLYFTLKKRNLSIYILCCASLYSTTYAKAATGEINPLVLTPYNLIYSSSYNGIDVKTSRSLTGESKVYILSATAKNMVSDISEQAIFEIDTHGTIAELKYQATKNILGLKKKELLLYDQAIGIASYESKKKQRQILLSNAHLNQLTYQIKLQSDLINGATSLDYSIIKKGKVKVYRFEILGEETLKTPLGEISTLKIRKIPEEDDRETFLWFAPRWHFMLIQLWQHEVGGDEYKMLLERGTLAGNQLSSATML
jgi:hypothetical protein